VSIESRIEKLEKQTGDTEVKPWLVVVYDDTGKPSEAVLEAAKADYKATHPDWQERDFNVIWAIDEDCKRMTEEVLQGKGT
jgi:hypothetical protein